MEMKFRRPPSLPTHSFCRWAILEDMLQHFPFSCTFRVQGTFSNFDARLSTPKVSELCILNNLSKYYFENCGDKRDREDQSGKTLKKSFTSLRRVPIQESEVNAIWPTSGSENLDLGTEALTRIVREVLEEVLKARLDRHRELVKNKCVDCEKKRDRSPWRLEPQSVKHERTHLSGNKGIVKGTGSGANAPFGEHCKKRHSGNYWKRVGAYFLCESREHWIRSVFDDIKTSIGLGYFVIVCCCCE
ncbi:uncharacterized protein LOC105791268 isoform X2 [Gossypium raimondii]|uniref:uncharacterized protein LOC105791268 isoform X2 n=1 Tax=Gossypium raimondii TaxID=29730 RepID=UPI00227A2BCF|nr:uncharacterized protein LOC105791268 isoform X2 [Gossypium raimondii]